MIRKTGFLLSVFLVAIAAAGADPPAPQNAQEHGRSAQAGEMLLATAQVIDEADLYQRGSRALDSGRWDEAIQHFSRVAQAGGRRADAALYWKAYALEKNGRRAEALATLAELQKAYPQSRWLNDAKALELELRQASGQAPRIESEADLELKLLAVNALMHRNADEAVPILEKLLQGSHPPKIKDRALFVLAQSGSPRAREVIAQIARGQSNPELQRTALRYLGLFGGKESRQALADIYAASSEVDVKREILQSFMVAGERERLLAVARTEANADLRKHAVHQLGVIGAENELMQLYAAESSVEVKKSILHSLAIGGRIEKLGELARSEKNAELRKSAIRNAGIVGGPRTAEILLAIYNEDKDVETRKEVLHALFIQGNARTLIDIARKETNAELKKQAVHWLSLMNSKEATDFLMELLNK